jgi:hypothetical protein
MKGSSIKTGRRLPCAYYGDHVATRFRRWVWSGLGGRSSTGDHVAGYLRSLFPRPLAEMGRQVDDGSTSFVLPSRPFFVHCKLIGYLTHPAYFPILLLGNYRLISFQNIGLTLFKISLELGPD